MSTICPVVPHTALPLSSLVFIHCSIAPLPGDVGTWFSLPGCCYCLKHVWPLRLCMEGSYGNFVTGLRSACGRTTHERGHICHHALHLWRRRLQRSMQEQMISMWLSSMTLRVGHRKCFRNTDHWQSISRGVWQTNCDTLFRARFSCRCFFSWRRSCKCKSFGAANHDRKCDFLFFGPVCAPVI